MDKKLDEALRQALAPCEEADFWLNQKILNRAAGLAENKEDIKEEKNKMGIRRKKRGLSAAAIAAAVLCTSSVTAYAAWKYLSSSDIAAHVQDRKLVDAFLSRQAFIINETQNYGDYRVTLLGIISGELLSEYPHGKENGRIATDRTYAVAAIEYADGRPVPDTSEEAYGELEFFVSPLIGGYNPALYNIADMSGNYTDITEDGILYRLLECDDIGIFAGYDRYLCVCEGTFYQKEAYIYDEETGKISRNQEYQGLNALFELPADGAEPDFEKAAEYMAGLGPETDIQKEKLYASPGESFEVHAPKAYKKGAAAASYALQFTGNPYAWGKDSLTEGTDSSGFTKSVCGHFGIRLPHDSARQREFGTKIENLEQAVPGDFIFYDMPAHVAIYIGDGMVVHAMPELGICISNAGFDEISEIRRIFDNSGSSSVS